MELLKENKESKYSMHLILKRLEEEKKELKLNISRNIIKRAIIYNIIKTKCKKELKEMKELKRKRDENIAASRIINAIYSKTIRDKFNKKLEEIKENKENKEIKYKKRNIPIALKISVWNKYIGEEIGKTKCLCCNDRFITQMQFHCGHIISEINGGKTNINNLKPICSICNFSMGRKNMDEFAKEYFNS